MLWVKSSRRRNSPRTNTFQQENRGRERKGVWQETNAVWNKTLPHSDCIPLLWICSFLSIAFVPPSLFSASLFLSLHSPASVSGIDLWLHAMRFLLWNWLDMYVIPRNYKSMTSTVWLEHPKSSIPCCVLFDLLSSDIQGGCSDCDEEL